MEDLRTKRIVRANKQRKADRLQAELKQVKAEIAKLNEEIVELRGEG